VNFTHAHKQVHIKHSCPHTHTRIHTRLDRVAASQNKKVSKSAPQRKVVYDEESSSKHLQLRQSQAKAASKRVSGTSVVNMCLFHRNVKRGFVFLDCV